jgi:hypothetical protein
MKRYDEHGEPRRRTLTEAVDDLGYWFDKRPWVWKAIGWLVGIAWTVAIIAGIVWQLTSS